MAPDAWLGGWLFAAMLIRSTAKALQEERPVLHVLNVRPLTSALPSAELATAVRPGRLRDGFAAQPINVRACRRAMCFFTFCRCFGYSWTPLLSKRNTLLIMHVPGPFLAFPGLGRVQGMLCRRRLPSGCKTASSSSSSSSSSCASRRPAHRRFSQYHKVVLLPCCEHGCLHFAVK